MGCDVATVVSIGHFFVPPVVRVGETVCPDSPKLDLRFGETKDGLGTFSVREPLKYQVTPRSGTLVLFV